MHGVREGLLHGRAGDVDDEVLVAGLLERFDGVVQLFEGSAPRDAEDDARLGRDGVHVGVVVLVGAVQDGLDVLDRLDGGLRGVDVFGVEDDARGSNAAAFLASATNLSRRRRRRGRNMDSTYSRSPMRS